LPVHDDGKIHTSDLKSALTDDTILVSIMYVNNETGIIQPIEEAANFLKDQDHQAVFHTDAVQAFDLIDIDVKTLGVDMLTVSSHKIGGPKGIGFLYAKENIKMQSLSYGCEQERKRRAGTKNVISAIGYQKAVELVKEQKESRKQAYEQYRKLFLEELTKQNVHHEVNGNINEAVPSIINISFPGVNVE